MKNRIRFNIYERSEIENMDFTGKKPENFNFIENYNKDYIEKILEEHIGLKAKKEIYTILQELDSSKNTGITLKNSGIILEEFLIKYFEDKFVLNKKDSEKWESNQIDFFYKNVGIQLTISHKTHSKINQINNNRKKIDLGENFFYERELNGKKQNIIINNKEIPNNLALFTISSKGIKRLVSENDFLKTITEFSLEEIMIFKRDLDIIQKSFVQIHDKINNLMNNSVLYNFNDGKEYPLNYNKNQVTIFNREIDKYVDDEIKNKPKLVNMNSNISFSYKEKEQIINFKVYENSEKNEQNIGKLIYEYKYFICNKVKKNNSFDGVEQNNIPDIGFQAEATNKSRKVGKISKYIKVFNQKLVDTKNSSKRKYKIDTNKRKEKILRKNLEELENNEDYKKFLIFYNNLTKEELKKIDIYKNSKIRENKEVIKKRKRMNWLGNFILGIENFLENEEGDLNEIGLGLFSDKELLLNDPILKENNFIEKAEKNYLIYKNIKTDLEKISIKGVDSSKILQRLQKVLFINATTSNSSKNYIDKAISNINKKIKENLVKIKELGGENINSKITNIKGGQKIDINENYLKNKKRPIGKLKEENKIIERLILNLEGILKGLLKIRRETIKVDFDRLLISDLNGENIIYTKKFLSDTLISFIFKGEKSVKTLERKKLIERLSIENFEVEKFLNLLNMYISFKDTLEENGLNPKPILFEKLKHLLKIKNKLELNINGKVNEEDIFIKNFLGQKDNLTKILSNIFGSNTLKNYNNLLLKFLFDISGRNEKKIKNEFFVLISNIGIENLKNTFKYNELLRNEKLKEEIEKITAFSSKGINILNTNELEELEQDILEKDLRLEELFSELKENNIFLKNNN